MKGHGRNAAVSDSLVADRNRFHTTPCRRTSRGGRLPEELPARILDHSSRYLMVVRRYYVVGLSNHAKGLILQRPPCRLAGTDPDDGSEICRVADGFKKQKT